MAVYVLMKKMEDNEEKVVYKFGPNEKHMGVIEFNKIKEEINVLESVNDGVLSNKAYERCAAEKIVKMIYKENGILPDITTIEK